MNQPTFKFTNDYDDNGGRTLSLDFEVHLDITDLAPIVDSGANDTLMGQIESKTRFLKLPFDQQTQLIAQVVSLVLKNPAPPTGGTVSVS